MENNKNYYKVKINELSENVNKIEVFSRAFYTMSENDVEEIIKKLSVEAGLHGYNEDNNQWEDFVLITSIEGINKGKCSWLDFDTKKSKQDIDLVTHAYLKK